MHRGGEWRNETGIRKEKIAETVLLWSSPMPPVPFSTLLFLSKECLDLLYHLRQEQMWQVLHLNLQTCTVWSPAVCQVFLGFSKGFWRCPSLFNTFIFLTYTAVLTPVYFANWAKALKILITGKTNHTLFCVEMWATLWSYDESYKLLLKYLPIPSSWVYLSVNISVEKICLKNCRGIVLVPSISDYFFCLQGPLVKQVINLVVECSTPTGNIQWIKRGNIWLPPESNEMLFSGCSWAVQLFHANHSICYSFPIFFFSKLLGNLPYWQAHLPVVVSSEYYCTSSINPLL